MTDKNVVNMTEFDFVLKDPIQFDNQGKIETGNALVLKAPSNAQRRWTTQIKAAFMGAVAEQQRNAPADMISNAKAQAQASGKDANASMTGGEIMAVIYSSSGDIEKVESAFKSLILSQGICMIEGKQALTNILFDKISDRDMDRLMGDYLANFFIGSLIGQIS